MPYNSRPFHSNVHHVSWPRDLTPCSRRSHYSSLIPQVVIADPGREFSPAIETVSGALLFLCENSGSFFCAFLNPYHAEHQIPIDIHPPSVRYHSPCTSAFPQGHLVPRTHLPCDAGQAGVA